MALVRIMSFIDDIILQIKLDILTTCVGKKLKQYQDYITCLNHINSLLNMALATNDIRQVTAAIRFIENLSLAMPLSLFSHHALRFSQWMKVKGQLVGDMKPDTARDFNQHFTIPFKECTNLNRVYRNLVKYFRFVERTTDLIAWEYGYQWYQGLDAHGSFLNEALAPWQAQQMQLDNAGIGGVKDFLRDISFDGLFRYHQQGLTIQESIQLFVQGAYDYQPIDKNLLVSWLLANGGQDNNRFMDQLIQANVIVTPSPGFVIGKSHALAQHWLICDGKLCFESDICIYSLHQGMDNMIIMDTDNRQVGGKIQYYAREISDPDFICSINPYQAYPLLRIRARSQLQIVELDEVKKVKPFISSLHISCYTPLLKPCFALSQAIVEVNHHDANTKQAINYEPQLTYP
jgi:hypothetical protein